MITWRRRCFQCTNPIDLDYDFLTEHYLRSFLKYLRLNPINLYRNQPFLKFYGLKVRRVCRHCFETPVVFNTTIHHLRQCGAIRHVVAPSKSKTEHELRLWNTWMFKYANKTLK